MRLLGHPQEHESNRPRLLILEHDEDVLQVTLEGLDRQCMRPQWRSSEDPIRRCACEAVSSPCLQVIDTLRELCEMDLDRWDLVICASSLGDGSGLDALAFTRGMKPDLPVILTGPPGESTLAVEAIRAGAADFLLTTGGNLLMLPLAIEKVLARHRIRRENERLQADLARAVAESALQNRQLEALIQHLESMARTDELTGLCNRRWFNMMLSRSWAEALRSGSPLAFAMMDLDGFKKVNDLRGHQRGDELLRLTGRVIHANSRSVDLPARYGGDEFCILMPHTEVWEAALVMERITAAFDAAMNDVGGGARAITMSTGISHVSISSRPASAEQLIRLADEALYAAKSAGKSRIMVHQANQIVAHEDAAGERVTG